MMCDGKSKACPMVSAHRGSGINEPAFTGNGVMEVGQRFFSHRCPFSLALKRVGMELGCVWQRKQPAASILGVIDCNELRRTFSTTLAQS